MGKIKGLLPGRSPTRMWPLVPPSRTSWSMCSTLILYSSSVGDVNSVCKSEEGVSWFLLASEGVPIVVEVKAAVLGPIP